MTCFAESLYYLCHTSIKFEQNGNAWTAIAGRLNELKSNSFQVDQRALRDRFNMLKNRFESKII